MKIVLKEWKREDIDDLVSLANNRSVSDNLRDRFPYPYTKEDGEAWIAINENNKQHRSFVIEVDGLFAGGCGIFPREDVYRLSAEIGYWIGEPFWRKGIATETIRQLLEKAKVIYPQMVRIFAEVFEHNKNSMKALEKNGFYLESIRKMAVVKNGKVFDDYVYVKLIK